MNVNRLKEIMEKADLKNKSALEEVKLYEVMRLVSFETAREIFEANAKKANEKFEAEHPIINKVDISLVQVIGEMDIALYDPEGLKTALHIKIREWKSAIMAYYFKNESMLMVNPPTNQ